MLFAIVRVWLGSMFVYSAGLKLAQYDRRRSFVKAYKILPASMAPFVDLMLPWAELLGGLLLLLRYGHPVGPLLTFVLGTAFAYASGRVLRMKEAVPCGCTGNTRDRVTWVTFARALAVAVGSLLLLAPDLSGGTTLPSFMTGLIVLVALLPGGRASFFHIRQAQALKKRRQENEEEIKRLSRLLATPERSAS
jgi:hypothetical protein